MERALGRNNWWRNIFFSGMLSSFVTTFIGLGIVGYNQTNIERSDLIREYQLIQQTAGILRSANIDNQQYLDGIISGLESGVGRIETERSDELSAYNAEVKRRKDNSVAGGLIVLGGVALGCLGAGATDYTNRREKKLYLREEELRREDREPHPVKAYSF
ncbi:MAG: hypothetical protein KKC19_02780 [Nanoarchaeota archaeon]|nr:hypothetical protein [Nanoarchaeota archaeon]